MSYTDRVKNSGRNAAYGLLSQFVALTMNFVVRTVFIRYFDVAYLGINGLFTNVLTILSLAELGFGTAMIHYMYKPLALGDVPGMQALLKYYRKVYRYIGLVVLTLGLGIIPFLDYFVGETPQIDGILYIYLLYLFNSVSSYFYSYSRTVFDADQKSYINARYRYYFVIIKSFTQIIALVIYADFLLFLLIQILMTVAENVFVSLLARRKYSAFFVENDKRLGRDKIQRINRDVRALMLSRVAHVALNGTDNIIISSFIGLGAVGLLSNYTMLTGTLVMILSTVTRAATGSIGNYLAVERSENRHQLFRKVDFITFWLYAFCTVCFVTLANPFINAWLGPAYELEWVVVLVIGLNFLIDGMLNSFWIFRSTLGLFTQGRYRPLIAALLNIFFSLLLVKYLGLLGVLLGTTISKSLVNIWYDPYLIHKHGLFTPLRGYARISLFRLTLTASMVVGIRLALSLFPVQAYNFLSFTLLALAVATFTAGVFLLVYRKTSEFQYFLSLLAKLVRRRA